jgi:hypothetical protein
VAHSWGTTRSDDGKVVWCKVPSGALPRPRSYRPWPAAEPVVDRPKVPIAGAPRRRSDENPNL